MSKLFFLGKRSKNTANPLYLLGFDSVPTIHKSTLTLRNFFTVQKTTCSYSSLLQVFSRVEQTFTGYASLQSLHPNHSLIL